MRPQPGFAAVRCRTTRTDGHSRWFKALVSWRLASRAAGVGEDTGLVERHQPRDAGVPVGDDDGHEEVGQGVHPGPVVGGDVHERFGALRVGLGARQELQAGLVGGGEAFADALLLAADGRGGLGSDRQASAKPVCLVVVVDQDIGAVRILLQAVVGEGVDLVGAPSVSMSSSVATRTSTLLIRTDASSPQPTCGAWCSCGT